MTNKPVNIVPHDVRTDTRTDGSTNTPTNARHQKVSDVQMQAMQVSEAIQHARFCALVEPHIEAVGRFVYALTRNREAARDITSDVMMIAFEKLDMIQHEHASASWLFSVARNLVYQRRRRQKFWGFFDETASLERPSPDALPDISADVGFLHDALATLPEAQREALVLFEIAGLPLEEIRQIQGGTLSGVKSRLARGREELKKIMNTKTYNTVIETLPSGAMKS